MRCDIITLFPDMVAPVLGQSILKRAQEKGLLEARVWNLRDFTFDRHRVADDTPYGGGAGMVLKAEPLFRAVDALRQEYGESTPGARLRLLLPSPQGRPLTEPVARELRDEPRRLVFLCGHYEGIDERIVRRDLVVQELCARLHLLDSGARFIAACFRSALLKPREPRLKGLVIVGATRRERGTACVQSFFVQPVRAHRNPEQQ